MVEVDAIPKHFSTPQAQSRSCILYRLNTSQRESFYSRMTTLNLFLIPIVLISSPIWCRASVPLVVSKGSTAAATFDLGDMKVELLIDSAEINLAVVVRCDPIQ